jgi:di/tricarboxylate transporter
VNPAPIAYQLAQESHADPKPFMVGLAICISTSFCTPVAHETTMLADAAGNHGSVSTTLYGFTPN